MKRYFGNNNNDRSDRSSSRGSGGRGSDRVEMHDAVCDDCGRDCKVPFRPSGDKPIYCSKCFENHDDRGSSNKSDRGNRRDSSRRSNDIQMFSAVCDECGNDCEVPFRPSGDKPIYCSRCFEKVDPKRDERGSRSSRRDSGSNFRDNNRSKPSGGADLSQFKDQLGSISAKLDKLLRLLEPVITTEVEKDFEVEVKEINAVKEEKPKKKKATKKTAAKKTTKTKKK